MEGPLTFNELIRELHKVFETVESVEFGTVKIDEVKALMARYTSNHDDWKRFAMFDPHKYTRNLVDEGNGKFNLIVLCWNMAQSSTVHSHSNSHCVMKVLDGKVKEELFDWPKGGDEHPGMDVRKTTIYETNQVAYINDEIGLHRIGNPSHADGAVTLHLYSPPFSECKCFDQSTSHESVGKMTYWSRFGEIVS